MAGGGAGKREEGCLVFCFIKYICLSREKLAGTSKNCGIFGLTNRFIKKYHYGIDFIRDNFVTWKILCNLRKVHRGQQGTGQRKSSRKCRCTQYTRGGYSSWALHSADLQRNQFMYQLKDNLVICHRTSVSWKLTLSLQSWSLNHCRLIVQNWGSRFKILLRLFCNKLFWFSNVSRKGPMDAKLSPSLQPLGHHMKTGILLLDHSDSSAVQMIFWMCDCSTCLWFPIYTSC